MNFETKLPRLACVGTPRPGVNCTVRMGDKWLRRFLKGDVDVLVISQHDGQPVVNATIQSAYFVQLGDVKPSWLARTVDAARTLNRLIARLEDAYPMVDLSSMVTVMFFTVTPARVEPVKPELEGVV